jgi:hypothetical protein
LKAVPHRVAVARSNAADQIADAVRALGRSKQRIAIFRAIYFGKKRAKTVNEIAVATGLDRVRVLQEGRRLADLDIVTQIGAAGMTAYEKKRFYSAQKSRILRLVQDPAAFASFPTGANPRATLPKDLTIRIPRSRIHALFITIDDIDSFYRVRSVRVEPGHYAAIPEERFKAGIAKILGESGRFRDWGGEQNDLYTSRLRIAGRRRLAAFAFKGPGTRGPLTPAKMGTNGDQIQRLFKTTAAVFIVQYWGEIKPSIIEQMEEFAKAKSAVSEVVYFGVIDGDDSHRLLKAYPGGFPALGHSP